MLWICDFMQVLVRRQGTAEEDQSIRVLVAARASTAVVGEGPSSGPGYVEIPLQASAAAAVLRVVLIKDELRELRGAGDQKRVATARLKHRCSSFSVELAAVHELVLLQVFHLLLDE